MVPVISGAVRAVGYDAASRTMRVAFRGGGTYDYLDVDPAVYERMRRPHPWHDIWRTVKSHPYRRVPDAAEKSPGG